jgi:hypothetical protein
MMIKPMIVEEIISLRDSGYSMREVIQHFEGKGMKAPSKPTLRKYYQMESAPDDSGSKLAKDKVFDHPPFREAIIEIIRNCKGKYCVSSVYDVLLEKYVDSGSIESLPGNEQTLRNYVKYLTESGIIDEMPKNQRIYDHVFDTPPGDQLILDFGEVRFEQGKQVHFICLLLRYSRLFCVYAQDHKYNSEEACKDIYRAFRRFGGRPLRFVIDQDSVFVASETYGEVIKTRVFNDFCTEQGIKLWVCNKADPESKGGVENLVGFVKKNFFSARNIKCVEDVWSALPGWVERKSRRIHKATYHIPLEVFEVTEQKALRPLIPSVYENTPSSYTFTGVGSSPYVLYKTCKYSVPRDYCFKTVCYKAAGEKIHIYDENRKYICSHELNRCKGSVNQLEEHKKKETDRWQPVMESLRAKWNCYDFQHFVNGFKKENPRHLYQQLTAVEQFLDAEAPSKDLVSEVMRRCCEGWRYQFGQFREVYFLAKGSLGAAEAPVMTDVQQTEMAAYQKAFEERCGL